MPTNREKYEPIARQKAQQYGIDPEIFVRQINQESGFNPNAGSPAGAQGIAQIVPKWHPTANVKDPVESLDYAARLMSNHLKNNDNRYDLALAQYNGGQDGRNYIRDGVLPKGRKLDTAQVSGYIKSILGSDNIKTNPQVEQKLQEIRQNPLDPSIVSNFYKSLGYDNLANDSSNILSSIPQNTIPSAPTLNIPQIPKPQTSTPSNNLLADVDVNSFINKEPISKGYSASPEVNQAVKPGLNQNVPFAKDHPILASVLGVGASIALPIGFGVAGGAAGNAPGALLGVTTGNLWASKFNNLLNTGNSELSVGDAALAVGSSFIPAGTGAVAKGLAPGIVKTSLTALSGAADDIFAGTVKGALPKLGVTAATGAVANIAQDYIATAGVNALGLKDNQGNPYTMDATQIAIDAILPGAFATVEFGMAARNIGKSKNLLDGLKANTSGLPDSTIIPAKSIVDPVTSGQKAVQIEQANQIRLQYPEIASLDSAALTKQYSDVNSKIQQLTVLDPTNPNRVVLEKKLNTLINAENKLFKAEQKDAIDTDRISSYRAERNLDDKYYKKNELIDRRTIAKNETLKAEAQAEIDLAKTSLISYYETTFGKENLSDVEGLINTHKRLIQDPTAAKSVAKDLTELSQQKQVLETELRGRDSEQALITSEIAQDQVPEINNNRLIQNSFELGPNTFEKLKEYKPSTAEDARAIGVVDEYLNDIKAISNAPRSFINNTLKALNNDNPYLGPTREDILDTIETLKKTDPENDDLKAITALAKLSIQDYPSVPISTDLQNFLNQTAPEIFSLKNEEFSLPGQEKSFILPDDNILDISIASARKSLMETLPDANAFSLLSSLDKGDFETFKNQSDFVSITSQLKEKLRIANPGFTDAELQSVSTIGYAIVSKAAKRNNISIDQAIKDLTINSKTSEELLKAKGVLYNLIGAKGISKLQGYENLIAAANTLEQQGLSKDDIYNEIGMERGADGHWRFDLAAAGLDTFSFKKFDLERNSRTTLGELIDYPGFFQAYPEVANMKVAYIADIDTAGQFITPDLVDEIKKGASGGFTTVRTNKGIESMLLLTKQNSDLALQQTVIHELQHSIQTDEGFAQGGSPNISQIAKGLNSFDLKTKDVDNQLSLLVQLNDITAYLSLAGEVEARNAANRVALFSSGEERLRPERTETLSNSEQYKFIPIPRSRQFLTKYKGFSSSLPEKIQQIQQANGSTLFQSSRKPFNQTNTPEFKKWFDGSKVLDENGKPLVVYHGTGKDFTTFKKQKGGNSHFGKGFYFSPDPDLAGWYSRGEKKANIKPVYLDIKNPAPEEVCKAVSKGLSQDKEFMSKVDNSDNGDELFSEKFTEGLQKLGYDGIINSDKKIIVAFEPNQIKSATGNSGAFDPNNPDIRFQINEGRALGAFNPSTNTISLTPEATPFTVVHELAHYYEGVLTQSERSAILKWANHGEWGIDTSEKFARGFETYLATRRAPVPFLTEIFKNFQRWSVELLDNVFGTDFLKDNSANASVKAIYDSMLEDASPRVYKRKKEIQRIKAEINNKKLTNPEREELQNKLSELGDRLEIDRVKDTMERQLPIKINDENFITPADENYTFLNKVLIEGAETALDKIAYAASPGDWTDATTGLKTTATQIITQIQDMESRFTSDTVDLIKDLRNTSNITAEGILKNNPKLVDAIIRKTAMNQATSAILRARNGGLKRSINTEWQIWQAAYSEIYTNLATNDRLIEDRVGRAIKKQSMAEGTDTPQYGDKVIQNLENFLTSAVQTSNPGQRRVSSVLIEPLSNISKRLRNKAEELTGLNPVDYVMNSHNANLISALLDAVPNYSEALSLKASALNIDQMLSVAGWTGLDANMALDPLVSFGSAVNSAIQSTIIQTQNLNALQAYANSKTTSLFNNMAQMPDTPFTKISPNEIETLQRWGYRVFNFQAIKEGKFWDLFENWNPIDSGSFSGLGERSLETADPIGKIHSTVQNRKGVMGAGELVSGWVRNAATMSIRLATAYAQQDLAESALVAAKQHLKTQNLEDGQYTEQQLAKTFQYFYSKFSNDTKSGLRAFLAPAFVGNAAVVDPRTWGTALDRFFEGTFARGARSTNPLLGSALKTVARLGGAVKATSTRFTGWYADEASKQLTGLKLFKEALDKQPSGPQKVNTLLKGLGAYALYAGIFGFRGTVVGGLMVATINALNAMSRGENPDQHLAELSIFTAAMPNWKQIGFQPMSGEKASMSPTALAGMVVNNREALYLAGWAGNSLKALDSRDYQAKRTADLEADKALNKTIYGRVLQNIGAFTTELSKFNDDRPLDEKIVDLGYSALNMLNSGTASAVKQYQALNQGYLSVPSNATMRDVVSGTIKGDVVNMSSATYEAYNKNLFFKTQFILSNCILGQRAYAVQEARREKSEQYNQDDPLRSITSKFAEL